MYGPDICLNCSNNPNYHNSSPLFEPPAYIYYPSTDSEDVQVVKNANIYLENGTEIATPNGDRYRVIDGELFLIVDGPIPKETMKRF